jgi:peptidoglycan hydrolase CwlO-like protein
MGRIKKEENYIPQKKKKQFNGGLSGKWRKWIITSWPQQNNEKLIEKALDTSNQKVQDALRKFQDTTNKEIDKTQKQISELREDFNKHQSETKDTIKREIYEIKKTTQNIKEELNKEMENLRKKQLNWNPGNKRYL